MNSGFLKKLTVIFLTALLTGLFFTGAVSGQGKDSFQTNRQEEETPAVKPGEGFPRDPDTPRQLTEQDIRQMNNGDCTMLFSEEGYLTFLRGRYYEEKVTNFEEGIESLFGMQQLLGILKGSEFFGVFGEKNPYGYTIITYQQRYGDLTLQNAVLKIILDPDGYTAGLVSSFTPNVGIAPEDVSSITAEEALQIVQEEYAEEELRFYPEDTRQTSVTTPDGIAMHCWAVFSGLLPEEARIDGAGYLEHLVSYDGEYLYHVRVSSPQEMVFGDDVKQEVARSWFDGLKPASYTGTVTRHDGTTKEVTVPVAYDPEQDLYYLADPERNILLADYYPYARSFTIDPWVSADNTGWPDRWLLVYETYEKLYSFYEAIGLQSTDGFGCPILILTDWVEDAPPHKPVHNAAFLGYYNGWALFAASEDGNYEECTDVIGHEFTHAVTEFTLAGSWYMNEPGAINEALSDIAGNLIEMMLGDTEDTQWLIAENSGWILRSMGNPWEYRQPVTMGGTYYMPSVTEATTANDNGGVHTNSSLLNIIAWKLHAAGMDPMEELLLFREAVNFLTPLSGFREVHQALIFAARVRQMDEDWIRRIDMYCEEAGY